jgi:uncharacterized protein YbaR (Trm112 family)
MLDPELLAYLVCPETHQDIAEADAAELGRLNQAIRDGKLRTVAGQPVQEAIDGALIRADGLVAYPVRDEIPVLLVAEGLDLRGHDFPLKVAPRG